MAIKVGLDFAHDSSPLDKLIAGHVARHGGLAPGAGADGASCFADGLFGIEHTRAFEALNEDARADVRRACAAGVLEEAYFIEKAGLAYGARMLLEAQDTASRQTYALLTGDEATHLAWVAPYIAPERRAARDDAFIRLIESLISEGPSPALVYILQVILEGWGLDHYQRLAGAAQDDNLRAVFQAILKDEALHHRAGTLMLAPDAFDADVRAFTLEALGAFLHMVACGPLRVVGALAQASGETSAAGLAACHAELNGEADAVRKLALLRSLMQADGMGWAVEALEVKGAFKAMKAADAVRLL